MLRHTAPHSSRTRLLLLLLAALLLTAAIAAAPAAAAPTPTVLTVVAQRDIVDYGAKGVLSGILQTTVEPIQPVDRQQVRVEYAASSTGPWTLAGTVTNTAELYTSGAYTYRWTAERSYYWRMDFPGTDEWAPFTGDVVLVKVRAVVGKPACPSTVKAGKKFTVSGALKPKYAAGSKTVTVRAQRLVKGHWKAYRSYLATSADSGAYSKYSVAIKLSGTGKYRFYGTTAATSMLAAGKSAFSRTLTVK